MTVRDLELFLVELPSAGRELAMRTLIVRLATDGRHEGWGEAACRWRASELLPRREWLLSLLVGRSVFASEDFRELCAPDDAALATALEMACWDLIGRTAGQPLCHLWGGRYRRRIPLAARLKAQPAEMAAAQARELVEQGFHAQQLVATGVLAQDVELVRAVREAVGARVELRLDAGQKYALPDARQLGRELEESGVEFLLDPLAAGGWEQLASLGRQINPPLAASVGVTSPEALLRLIRAGGAAAVVVNPQRVGGLSRTRKCAAVAEAAQLAMSLSSVGGLGLSVAAQLHLASATTNLQHAHATTYHLLGDDLLCEPLELVDGMLAVPEAPGLGVEVDRQKLEKYQAR